MARFDVRRSLNTAALWVLAAVAVPVATFAQRPGDTPAIENLQQQILAVQQRAGENSADLIDPLTALGVLYEERGDHARAAATIMQAVHIVRVTYGLYTLEQAPLLRRLIAANKAIGDYEPAWEIEQGLLTLAEEEPNCTAGSRDRVRIRLLHESEVLYSTAINILLQNEDYASDELPSLLRDLVRSSYRYNNVELGRRSLTYLLAYQATTSEPWLARIETLVVIADWDMVHAVGSNAIDKALDEYRQAYGLLTEHQVPQESIDRIFSPDLPVVLPAFQLNPLDGMETPLSKGHIEVGFEVTREGRSKRVRVLDATENSLWADEKRLTQVIAGRIFRPRMKDGVFPDSVPVVVRYYYEEGQPWFAAAGAADDGPLQQLPVGRVKVSGTRVKRAGAP